MLYEVVIRMETTVLIDADSEKEAMVLGARANDLAHPGLETVDVQVDAPNKKTFDLYQQRLIKAQNYRCEHCGKNAVKADWGPGWITCPGCGRHPLTPAQRAAQAGPPSSESGK